jgi:PKD repeat protein
VRGSIIKTNNEKNRIGSAAHTSIINKRSLLFALFAVYLAFILVSTIPYIAEQNDPHRGTISNDEYRSNLKFPENGEYGHYRQVTLFDNSTPGYIDLKYIYQTNTLYIERLENVKELKIDCMMMYAKKAQEVLGEDPNVEGFKNYKNYFKETNDGLFTVIINTNTPMEKLQFNSIPLPKRVLVNNNDWWNTETSYYSLSGEDIIITNIPQGTTNVDIYFQEATVIPPVAKFIISKERVIEGEEFYFDAGTSYDEDGTIETYLWDFGDGSQGTGSLIKHSYEKMGTYTITLTVRDNDHMEDKTTKKVIVITEDADSDNDNVPDILDPNPFTSFDTDEDGLSDDYESVVSRTNIYESDSDGDGWSDKEELDLNTDPVNPFDHPGDKQGKTKGEDEDIMEGMLVPIFIIVIIIVIFLVFIILIKKRKGELSDESEKDEIDKKPASILESENVPIGLIGPRTTRKLHYGESKEDAKEKTKSLKKPRMHERLDKPKVELIKWDRELSDDEKSELEELEMEASFLTPSDRKVLVERFKKK